MRPARLQKHGVQELGTTFRPTSTSTYRHGLMAMRCRQTSKELLLFRNHRLNSSLLLDSLAQEHSQQLVAYSRCVDPDVGCPQLVRAKQEHHFVDCQSIFLQEPQRFKLGCM